MTEMLKVYNPASGALVGEVPVSGPQEIKAMVAKATAAKKSWGNLPMHRRAKILYDFADLVGENLEELSVLLTAELCKPIKQSRADNTDVAAVTRAFVERASHLYGEVIRTDNQSGIFENDLIFTTREPLGTVACVVPFNYPTKMMAHKVAPALIMGNVCIVKAPSRDPLAVLKIIELLHEAGLPEGVCQGMVCTRDDCTEYLLAHADVQAISLTGSTQTGIKMAQIGAGSLKHMFLELGGNDPTLIFEDADVDAAVESIASSRIVNAGQTCCSCKRLIVQQKIYDEFTAKLVERLKKVKMGDAMDESNDMSCLISEEAAERVQRQIEATVAAGAKCLLGGKHQGAFMPPTVLADVRKDMDVALDMEIFGPVFPLIPFSTEEEGIEIANATQYGLSSGVITKDIMRALRVGRQLQAGAVVLNDHGNYRQTGQPFGGYKMTGIGREGTSCTLEELSQVKSYVLKKAFKLS
jgi:acyl-CoA reductase-like NAD-dependent aldehyde dehydrogenase